MPQDPNLYGQKGPKKDKRAMPLSTSLDFSSQLTSLMAKSTASSSSSAAIPLSSTGRARPSKSKDIFSNIHAKRKSKPTADKDTSSESRLRLRSPTGTEEDKAELDRARRKMEQKARLYASMKRGDYVAKEGEAAPLVDFDRKWAEKHLDGDSGGAAPGSAKDDDDDDDDDSSEEEDYKDTEIVEFTDEFGRQRQGTRAAQQRLERQQQRGAHTARELEQMSARPRAPAQLIHGDAVQAEAFTPADAAAMAALARKRDRSATPPEQAHYDAAREIRSKGTGFYAFNSRDEAVRASQMRGLVDERRRTQAARRDRADRADARRREIEARRREIGVRRSGAEERVARRVADRFLDGLGMEIAGGGGGGGGGEVDRAEGEESDRNGHVLEHPWEQTGDEGGGLGLRLRRQDRRASTLEA